MEGDRARRVYTTAAAAAREPNLLRSSRTGPVDRRDPVSVALHSNVLDEGDAIARY